MIERSLAHKVAAAGKVRVEGEFQRHVVVSVRHLSGTDSGGRWGTPGAYPVLYLARPREAVVIEAYRHLVEGSEGMTADMVQPRRVLTAEVTVSEVLDLRTPANLAAVGLTGEDLTSEVGDWTACQSVGRAAHQLGLHGIITPAAGGRGEVLALFDRHLTAQELPVLVREEVWTRLPADPRRLRLVTEGDGA